MNDKQILQQADEKALYGLDVDIIREGRLYFFSKLDKNAYLSIWYIKKTVMFHISIFFILLSAFLFAYIPFKKKLKNIKFITVSFIAMLILRIFMPQGLKYFASIIIIGIIISGIVLYIFYLKKQKDEKTVRETQTANK